MQEHAHQSTHTHTLARPHTRTLFISSYWQYWKKKNNCLSSLFIRVAPPWKHGLLKPCEDIFAQAGEMALRLRAHSVLQKTRISVPSTHTGQLATTCDSRSRESGALFWPLWHPHVCMHTTTNEHHAYTYVQSKCYLPIHSIPQFLELYPNDLLSSADLSILLCKPEANAEIGKHVLKRAFWELIWSKEQWVDISTLERKRLCV